MYTCAGLIIYKSNFILLNISYQNEHLECGQNGAATAIPTALQRAGVIPNSIRVFCGGFAGLTLAIRQFAIGESRRCLAEQNQALSPIWRIQITDALKI